VSRHLYELVTCVCVSVCLSLSCVCVCVCVSVIVLSSAVCTYTTQHRTVVIIIQTVITAEMLSVGGGEGRGGQGFNGP